MDTAQRLFLDATDVQRLLELCVIQAVGQCTDAPEQLAAWPVQRLLTLILPGALAVVAEHRLIGRRVSRVHQAPLPAVGLALLIPVFVKSQEVATRMQVLAQCIGLDSGGDGDVAGITVQVGLPQP
ncbi:hypothetical protein D3C79_893400 [compost metagenome]